MKKSVLISGLAALIFLSGCVSNGFSKNYTSWYDDGIIPEEAFLKEDETPELINASENIDLRFREISSEWNWCIGSVEFNAGEIRNEKINSSLTDLCRETGARTVLWAKKFTDTKTEFSLVPQTSYHTVTVGINTTVSYPVTTYIHNYYKVNHYDYTAYLFVPIPESYKADYAPGFSVADLTESEREKYKQNTGCLIDIVYKNSAAYFANLCHGDIITRINGSDIFTADDFYRFRKNAETGDSWKIKIVRDGAEKEISLIYGLDKLMN